MANEGELERATDAFVKGAQHLAQNGVSLQVIVNALIGATVTVCYYGQEPPEKLSAALRQCANQVQAMYARQDTVEKGGGKLN
jgi:hypothetical protein